jgi:DNA repair protein RecO (recombination protein O)
MLSWSDEAIVLGKRPFGEGKAILDLFTFDHGRYMGILDGATSSKKRGFTEPGTIVHATWSSRLPDQLGRWRLELKSTILADILEYPLRLLSLTVAADLTRLVMAEREAHPNFFIGWKDFLKDLPSTRWVEAYVYFELMLLKEVGFGLSLETCAIEGTRENLIYVSPKTGRAVSEKIGRPYHDKLLTLPGFLNQRSQATAQELVDALTLTGYFLVEHALDRGRCKDVLDSRDRLIKNIASSIK